MLPITPAKTCQMCLLLTLRKVSSLDAYSFQMYRLQTHQLPVGFEMYQHTELQHLVSVYQI